MGNALKIRDDRSPEELRGLARRERDGRAAARLYAIANALEGLSRAEAARLAGMERQALRDAVIRYNAEGLDGLHDRPKGRPPRRLTEGEEAALAAVILRGPEPERDGVCAWNRADLCGWMAEHFGKTYHPSSLTKVLRRMGFSRQKARPAHAKRDARAQDWFQKKGFAPGLCQRGYQWAYIFTAVRPATGEDFTLVLPSVSAAVMNLYLAAFAGALDDGVHAVMVLDRAGWHDARALAVPDNVTLLALPPDSPELNPVERIWLYPRERFLSLRVLDDTEAIIEACCQAWNQLLAEPGRIQSLCDDPWIRKLTS